MKNLVLLVSIFYTSFTFGQDIKVINVKSNDIIYAESLNKIYATIGSTESNGNSICIINPNFGTIEECFFLGSEPGHMAITPDEDYLYIGLNGAPQVLKFNTSTNTVEQVIELGINNDPPTPEPYFAGDIEVLPNQPNSIAIALNENGNTNNFAAVGIYDDGVRRPNITDFPSPATNSIAFAEVNDKLFGYNSENTGFSFTELIIDEDGVSIGTITGGLVNGFRVQIESQGDFIYSGRGRVVDVTVSPPTLKGNFVLSDAFRSAVEPAPDANLVYFISRSGANDFALQTFDKLTFLKTDHFDFDDYEFDGEILNMINWGPNGKLAFHTEEEIVILRTCEALINPDLILDPVSYGGCDGEEITISAIDGYDNYYWNNGANSQNFTTPEEGDFSFSVADSLGCLSDPSNIVTVQLDEKPEPPLISFDTDTTLICQGQSVQLTANSSSTIVTNYVWSNGEASQTISVNETGTYSASAVTTNGCESDPSVPIQITVLEDSIPAVPNINIQGETAFCGGDSVILSGPENYNFYFWSNGASTQEVVITSTETISLQVANILECTSAPSDDVVITVSTIAQPIIQANGNTLLSSYANGNQWFLNGQLIPGATGQFYTATEDGFYTVKVSIDGCESSFSEPYDLVLINTVNPSEEVLVRISPNPAKEVVNIEIEGSGLFIKQIEIYNNLGQQINTVVVEQRLNTLQIPIEQLENGIYLIRAKGEHELPLFSKQILKL